MGLETGNYLDDLVQANPDGGADPKSGGDNHLRLIKTVLKQTFPGFAGRFNRVQTKSGNYTPVLNDSHTLIDFTADATMALTAAATLGNGWSLSVYASGGDVTIDPDSSEQINGEDTVTLFAGHAGVIFCDGSGFYLFQYSEGVPVGTVLDFAGDTPPGGYLLCYGQAVNRADYPALFAAIGTIHGAGNGTTTFNLPDLRGRVAAGKDDMGGSSANRLTDLTGGLNGDTLGDTGGEEAHILTEAELAAHDHTANVTDPGHTHSRTFDLQNLSGGSAPNVLVFPGSGVGSAAFNDSAAVTGITVDIVDAGSDTAHNNVQPTIILNKIIKF